LPVPINPTPYKAASDETRLQEDGFIKLKAVPTPDELREHVGSICGQAYEVWITADDTLIFDASRLHGVWNAESQTALALQTMTKGVIMRDDFKNKYSELYTPAYHVDSSVQRAADRKRQKTIASKAVGGIQRSTRSTHSLTK
jgi:hypothetical protein